MSRAIDVLRQDTPPREDQTEAHARAFMRCLYEAHLMDCDDADSVGGPDMRRDDWPIHEVPLWVVRELAK